MTTSARRIEANLRNSRRSTGPRTLIGKGTSRPNAITHGLTSGTLILPGEDPLEFQNRLVSWTARLEPCNPFEHDLVRQAVSHSWRLDRADRVQHALLAQRLAEVPEEDERHRREQVEDLGRRLLPFPRQPVHTFVPDAWRDLDRLKFTRPDDPDVPERLLNRLETTADGCRWLLDRWAELRTIADAGSHWPPAEIVQAIRLLSKDPLDAADDRQVLEIIAACFALDPQRRDPFAVLWERTNRPEKAYFEERLLGRRLRQAEPPSKETAREVLLGVVDAAVERLEAALEQGHRQRGERVREALAYDDSPEGEWVRRQQEKSTRAIFTDPGAVPQGAAAGRATAAAAPAPADDRAGSGGRARVDRPGGTTAAVRWTASRGVGRGASAGGGADVRPGLPAVPVHAQADEPGASGVDHPADVPVAGLDGAATAASARGGGRTGGRLGPTRSARGQRPLRPADDRGRFAARLDPLPDGPGLAVGPLKVVFHPRNRQNEPKDGGFSPVLPGRTRSLADRSRGPPGSGIDLAAADRRSSEPAEAGLSGTRAPWERMVDQTGHVH